MAVKAQQEIFILNNDNLNEGIRHLERTLNTGWRVSTCVKINSDKTLFVLEK